MALINVVAPEQAEGELKQMYSMWDAFGMVPLPFQMRSVSPSLLAIQQKYIAYYHAHPTLNLGLLSLIRMLVAEELQYHYCVRLNSQVLQSVGIASDDQLGAIMADPASAPLEDKDKAMLLFVLKAVKTPEAVDQGAVENLKALGWTDGDMVDAVQHGANMVLDGIMFKTFKLDDEGAAC
jgi:hypothetical protein